MITTLVAEREEEPKRSLMRVKKSQKLAWNSTFKKLIMASDLITSWWIEGEKVGAVTDFVFLDSKITADSEYSHEIKRHLLLERNERHDKLSILKSRAITLLTKMCIVKAMVFPVVNVWMWKLTHKEGWATKNWCFWIVLLERTLENPLDHKEIKLVNPKGNQAWIFTGRTDAEAPMATWCEQSTHWRRPWCWKRLKGKRERGGRRWNG